MNHVVNCVLIFNLNGDLDHVFNLEVNFNLFVWYKPACHVWYYVVQLVSYSGRMSYIWCVILIVVALVIVFKKFIVVVEFFVFYSLLRIDLCFGVLGLVDIKLSVILIIR